MKPAAADATTTTTPTPATATTAGIALALIVLLVGCTALMPSSSVASPATTPTAAVAPPSLAPTNVATTDVAPMFTLPPEPTRTPQARLIMPTIAALEPSEAAPGDMVKVLGSGGFIVRPVSSIAEAARSFEMTLDGDYVGKVDCLADYCIGLLWVPDDAAPGPHTVAVEGGSSLTLTVVEERAGSPGAPGGHRIAFTSTRDGWDLYLMNPDGSGVQRLTADQADDESCAASPDGAFLAFVSNRLDQLGVFILDLSYGALYIPLADERVKSFPAWSPAGLRLAFAMSEYGDPMDLYVISSIGSDLTALTQSPADDITPDWWTDGRLVFASGTQDSHDLFIMNGDGTGLTRLTDDPADDLDPSWSPDGTRILFTSNRGGDYEIYQINPDGSGLIQLTDAHDYSIHPRWSPDGTRIVFQTYRDDNPEIYLMNADGSNSVNLTRSEYGEFGPCWVPGR